MKILTSLLTAILMCSSAVSAPVTQAPSGPIITGRIAELKIFSRWMGETRWAFVMTDVKVLQDSTALRTHLKGNNDRFSTMIQQPYQLFRYRGNFVGAIVGKDCKVYLDEDMKVVKTEGSWQIPGQEGKYIPEAAQQSAR